MTDRRLFAAALGFAFVAAWIAFNFGYALLCLLGAAAFFLAAGVLEGNVDLGEMQARFTQRSEGSGSTTTPRPRRGRVQ